MGSIKPQPSLETYSVQDETRNLLQIAIFDNPKIAKNLPKGISEFASRIAFTGNRLPSIPISWRFTESVAALKGLEACIVAQLVKRKYGVDIEHANINTDHASLYFMSCLIWSISGEPRVSDPDAGKTVIANFFKNGSSLVPDYNTYAKPPSSYRSNVTNIYQTKDKRWFHLHGSLNAAPSLKSVGLPAPDPSDPELNNNSQKAIDLISARMKEIDSADMQHRAADVYKQAGVICNSLSEFRNSEHGKANSHVGLFEIHNVDSGHSPSWWPDSPQTSAERPLAGLKVVDLTRIIAAPAVTRGLAELGASIMRVTSPNLPDNSGLHIEMNWGKWNCSLDLKQPGDVEKLKTLILDADVVVQGYRPGVLDKYGLSQDDIIKLVESRERGIISVRENCYGWNGPWQGRSGWQQISDACVGISHQFGQSLGLTDDEPVTPVFPNSDYQTGLIGVIGILTALLRRAEKGGSYKVDLALNYYNQWLADSIGEYPPDVWEDVWSRNGRKVYRAHDNMNVLLPEFVEMLNKNSRETVFNKDFFIDVESKALGTSFYIVKPITNFEEGRIKLGFNVGTRGNGKDTARWPEDLMVEVVE